MRYLIAAFGLMSATGAQAALDLNYVADSFGAGAPITKLRLVGYGIERHFYEDMCIVTGPCALPPESAGNIKIDVTFSFAPVSRTGLQTIDSGIVQPPGQNSIIGRISFRDGDFVSARGFRDPGGYGCNYTYTEENYSPKSFNYSDMWCTHVPGEWVDYGIKNYVTRSGKITEIYINDVRVPEPATWAMMIAGFGLVGAALRRRSAEGRSAS